MFQAIYELQKRFNSKNLHMINRFLDKIFQKFNFYFINQNNQSINEKQFIIERKNESKILIIENIESPYSEYLLIVFDETIILLSKSDNSFLNDLLFKQIDSTIFTTSNKIYSIIPAKFQSHLFPYEKLLKDEYETTIDYFSENLVIKLQDITNKQEINKFWKSIRRIISSYFVNQSYKKLQEKHELIYDNKTQEVQIQKEQFIILQELGRSHTSFVKLIYHIEKGELFAVKGSNNSNDDKLFKREFNNLKNIQHPNISKIYGTTKIDGIDCLVIEYIRGKTLKQIKEIELTDNDRIRIIFQLMLTIEFLQRKQFIYRDLKPNNLIINHHKNLILIDFDRMIGINEQNITDETTLDFDNLYMAPEILDGSIKYYSYEEDVYSIGLLIHFILTGKFPFKNRKDKSNKENYSFDDLPNSYKNMIKLCEACCESEPRYRPKIAKLIDCFYNNFIFHDIKQNSININDTNFYPKWNCDEQYFNTHFNNEFNQQTIKKYSYETNECHLLFQLRFLQMSYTEQYIKDNVVKFINYLMNIYISEESKKEARFYLSLIYKRYLNDNYKSLHYLILSNCQNDSDAYFILGKFFYENKDISKAIHYFNLSANLNNSNAQQYLGHIYLNNLYVSRDINKAIYYFTLSANQNNAESQYFLGMIYYEGKYILRDIDKSIHYLTLAANQNATISQAYLGRIYYEGKYAQRDIDKSIHYLTLAANQNDKLSQFYLGIIYYEGKYILRDVNKSIHYFTLSVNYNKGMSEYFLGMIYYEGKYILRDINKSIHYFTSAANQNNAKSQLYLGVIFYDKKFVQRDINKAIFFLNLAANQNNHTAQFYLGMIYYLDEKIPRDINKAITYFKFSANQGNSNAQYYLGYIYYYIIRDINNSLYYFNLSAKKNNKYSQFQLGYIYITDMSIPYDINKSFYYLSLSANQNYQFAQYYLGYIYYKGEYVNQDIDKAIYYFTLCANQNNKFAQYHLGYIYYTGEYVKQNINKALHYFTLSANQNYLQAQSYLGHLYYEGKYVKQDINKSISYFLLSSDHNYHWSQYFLGLIFFDGKLIQKNIEYAKKYFILSAKNGSIISKFIIGFFYHQGKYIEQDIYEAIKYYKDASNMNYNLSKNNLGIIYKNGFSNEIKANIQRSIEYFNEAIKLHNDIIAMYNLSHLYFYKFDTEEYLDKSIELLTTITTNDKSFNQPFVLLGLALIKKYEFRIDKINDLLNKQIEYGNKNQSKTYEIIFNNELYIECNYNRIYTQYSDIDFLYNHKHIPIATHKLFNYKTKQKNKEKSVNGTKYNLTKDFYEGFGQI